MPSELPEGSAEWLAAFHAGDRAVLERCYRDYFATVHRAVGRVVQGADQETVVHDLFVKLLERESVRRSFGGGALGAWLTTLGRNQAVDFLRKHGRESAAAPEDLNALVDQAQEDTGGRLDAQDIVARFRREVLPEKWAAVFQARFIEQLSQREAAAKLGVRRTTLAYQESRVRRLLERFVLREAR